MPSFDMKFHGPLKLIKKKRELFQGIATLSQASLAVLPLQFPIIWGRNVGPTTLSASPRGKQKAGFPVIS